MRNIRSILFVFAALVMATATQAQQTKVTAFVPFDFVAGDHAYSAGQYDLKSLSGASKIIQITDNRASDTNSMLSHSCQSLSPADDTKLVFKRMGGTYFLYQIWTAGNQYGREFSRSQTEKMLAQNHESPENVIVAANLTK